MNKVDGPKEFPPRIWVKLDNEIGDPCAEFRGIAPFLPPEEKMGLPEYDEPYLSLQEHSSILADAVAKARGDIATHRALVEVFNAANLFIDTTQEVSKRVGHRGG